MSRGPGEGALGGSGLCRLPAGRKALECIRGEVVIFFFNFIIKNITLNLPS